MVGNGSPLTPSIIHRGRDREESSKTSVVGVVKEDAAVRGITGGIGLLGIT